MDRSELKKAYEETKRPMGVYAIRRIESTTIYVGSGVDMQARINRHRTELRFGSHRNRELQNEWKAFGESSFQFQIVDELKSADERKTDVVKELQVLSEMWIRQFEQEGCRIVKL